MSTRTGPDRPAVARPGLRRTVAMAALAVGAAGLAGVPVLAGTASAAAAPAAAGAAKGTVITTATTAFGRSLVVGSGKFAGFTLYFITSDHGKSFGCTSKPVTTPVGRLLCTGPSGDKNAEWPAITTRGRPVAGGGVSQKLLGTVKRAGIGEQVTYAGHPLYLFDSGPGQVTGEGWDEPGLPPWHGVWYLMAPSGRALPWAGTLTTTRIGGKTVLAAPMLTGVGWVSFPVYSYSRDSSSRSRCAGSCARAWPAMLTQGRPGLSGGLSPGRLGTLRTPAGIQVRYRGRPLYLFAFEDLAQTPAGIRAAGNGNGIKVAGGTFRLVRA